MIIHPITGRFTLAPGIQQTNSTKKYAASDKSAKNITTLPFAYNDISFGKNLNYRDFLISMRKVYKNKSIKNVVLSTIGDKKNYLGSGFSADVYTIPGIENYLIRIERKHFSPNNFAQTPILSEPQNELAPNFGQYVATNNQGLFITKKVIGESHSLPNWAEKIKGVEHGTDTITHKNAKLIADKVIMLADMPQQSFDELAENIQKLNLHTDCEIDIMNPNNLIVDNANKKINIIDLWYHHSENGSTAPFNGIDSMINLMLDPLTHTKVYDQLSISDKDIFKKASENIIKKVLVAGNKAGLERTNKNAMIIYSDFDKNAGLNFATQAYSEFAQMYSNIL